MAFNLEAAMRIDQKKDDEIKDLRRQIDSLNEKFDKVSDQMIRHSQKDEDWFRKQEEEKFQEAEKDFLHFF